MHSFETNQTNVPAFLMKLWKLVEDTSCDELIAWSDNGTSFIIRDQSRFAKELLPQYFKHNNMASFIRQLNMYGFRKVMNYDRTSLRGEGDEMEFMHSFFCKGQGALLELIKRKIPNTKVVVEPAVKSNAKDILTDLTSIKEKQESMDSMLLKMKQENELLWRELTSMRQKHKAQEQIISKVISFLVNIVQRSNPNVGVQRNITRMLQDIPSNHAAAKMSRTLDVLSKKNCFITDKVVSPLGPVIHEVTEFDHESDAFNPPSAKSIDEKSDKGNSEMENDSENPLNSSLNSPINTSLALEPLSILEPLQSSGIPTGDEACNSAGESVLGIPLEYISVPIEESPASVRSLLAENGNSEAIPLSENNFEPVSSFSPNPQSVLVYSPSPEKKDFEDNMFESLNTPQVPVLHIEDDALLGTVPQEIKNNKNSPSKVQTAVKGSLLNGNKVQKSTGEILAQNDHNYQLAVPTNSSSLVRSPSLTNGGKRRAPFSKYSEMGYCSPVPIMDKRNTLSNHLLNVEEELNWLQDQIASNSWNLDANKLLGLFSADDVANNEALIGDISVENIKTEPIDVIGNELVQFTPSMLEVELNTDSNTFFDCLNQDAQVPSANDGSTEQKEILSVLNEQVDQMAASEAAEYFLGNGDLLKQKSPKRRSKCLKSQKNKRKKLK